MKETLERIAIAIEDNTRAVRETLDYIRKRDAEVMDYNRQRDAEAKEVYSPTYKSGNRLNEILIDERRIARERFLGASIVLEETNPGGAMNDVLAEEIR
jgi:hypothetical protein